MKAVRELNLMLLACAVSGVAVGLAANRGALPMRFAVVLLVAIGLWAAIAFAARRSRLTFLRSLRA